MTAWIVAAARALPLALVLPIGPVSVRGIVGLVMAGVVGAALPGEVRDVGAWGLVVEGLVGAAIGLAASVPMVAAEAAGLIVDVGVGWARGRFGRLYGLFALAAFGLAGGPVLVVDALGRSYAAVPPGRVVVGGSAVVIEAVGRIVLASVELAAPVLAALLVAQIGVGLIERAGGAAARRVWSGPGGLTGRMIVGLIAVAVSAGGAAVWLGGGVRGLGGELAATLRLLAGG